MKPRGKIISRTADCTERSGAKNKALKQQTHDVEENNAAQHQNITPRFCKECGERLMENSKFFHKCGTTVLMPQAGPAAPTRPTPVPASDVLSDATPMSPKCDKKTMRKIRGMPYRSLLHWKLLGITWGTQSY